MAHTEGGKTGLDLGTIGVTIGAGLSITALSIFAFGTAVKCRYVPAVAPRCHARHPYTVYKPKNAATGPADPQIRGGNAYFGWITWCMSLTYDQMLQGVPGTGTFIHTTCRNCSGACSDESNLRNIFLSIHLYEKEREMKE